MTEKDSQALHKIETHEAVCSERYGQIFQVLNDLRKDMSDIRDENRSLRNELNRINLKIAYFLGASAVGSVIGAGLFQLFSGLLAK